MSRQSLCGKQKERLISFTLFWHTRLWRKIFLILLMQQWRRFLFFKKRSLKKYFWCTGFSFFISYFHFVRFPIRTLAASLLHLEASHFSYFVSTRASILTSPRGQSPSSEGHCAVKKTIHLTVTKRIYAGVFWSATSIGIIKKSTWIGLGKDFGRGLKETNIDCW